MRYFKKDKLQVFVSDTREEMGRLSGQDILAQIRLLLAVKDELNIMFAAAPSQNDVLAEIAAAKDIDWGRVNAFHMDEYIGLSPDAPQGFGNFLRAHIFDALPLKSVSYINPAAPDPQQEADRYAQLLLQHPMDICILGVGENGHVAFNDPGEADFNDSALVKPVHLDERCRLQQVNDGCFSSLDNVPKMAMTVTVPGLLRAKAMFCIVPTRLKAEAIGHMLTEEISPTCPASILRTKDCARLYLDKDAASCIAAAD